MKKMMMFLAASAVLFAVACDKDDDVRPVDQLDAATLEAVMALYPSGNVVDVDVYQDFVEVEVMDGMVSRDVYFDKQGRWLRTKTDVRVADLPSAVTNAIAASEHAALYIDDAEWVETPEGSYYVIELDSNPDVYLQITAEGVIL
jgi:hypothetical protein